MSAILRITNIVSKDEAEAVTRLAFRLSFYIHGGGRFLRTSDTRARAQIQPAGETVRNSHQKSTSHKTHNQWQKVVT